MLPEETQAEDWKKHVRPNVPAEPDKLEVWMPQGADRHLKEEVIVPWMGTTAEASLESS